MIYHFVLNTTLGVKSPLDNHEVMAMPHSLIMRMLSRLPDGSQAGNKENEMEIKFLTKYNILLIGMLARIWAG